MKVKKIEYPSVKEEVTYLTLDNGLEVILVPKNDYRETYALLSTKFGSIDRDICKSDEEVKVYPAGVAHFLEHKLFEDEEGYDYLEKFVELGADSNAFTTYHRTAYLFSLTNQEQLSSAMSLLFQMLSQLHVTDENVAREKEIIKQEIIMYEDQVDDYLYYKTLANLYPETSLANDIAGSVTSVDAISKEDLQENFSYFYQPSNMTFTLVGRFDTDEVLDFFSQQEQDVDSDVNVLVDRDLPSYPVRDGESIRRDIATPKLSIGLRSKKKLEGISNIRYKVILRILFSMMFGWTSRRFQELYEAGKIDHSLAMEIEVEDTYQFFIMTMETEEPLSLSHQLKQAIKDFAEDDDINEEHLDSVKRETFGDLLQSLNSLEFIAGELVGSKSPDQIFDIPQILQELDLRQVLQVAHDFIDDADLIDFTVFPK